ncbi:hypothetical protein L9G16_07025 [Shewanella sp. A25]|nr:hypothetical protein [Shewanella shenzhenensis]
MKFNRNGISFNYSDSWGLVEEEWDENISSLTFESESGIYMIDIYHHDSTRSLEDYAKIHFDSFVRELPFFSWISAAPKITATSSHGISGLILEFAARSCLIFNSTYINPIFRHSSSNAISFISAQYAKCNANHEAASLNQVLGSYSVS